MVLFTWTTWLFWLCSPERQVELHTLNLLSRASRQNWVAVGAMVAADYRDAWGHVKEDALRDAEEFGRHFFSLRIGPVEPLAVKKETGSMLVIARLGIYGSGTPVAQAMIEAMQELEEPFVFRWRKSGVWFWQWDLAEVRQEELASVDRTMPPPAGSR